MTTKLNLNELLPIISQHYKGEDRQLINARSLWKFLEVKSRFDDWFRNRIDEYDFKEKRDYWLLFNPKNLGAKNKQRGGHNQKDYLITLSMAKELAMVEKNAQGKAARRYFIDCETELKAIAPDVHLRLINQWQENRELASKPYKSLCIALDKNRQRQGKQTHKFLYGNESKMLTSIVLGMSVEKFKALHQIKGEVREHLSTEQLDELQYLENADEMLLDADMTDFEERRMKLIAMRNNRFSKVA